METISFIPVLSILMLILIIRRVLIIKKAKRESYRRYVEFQEMIIKDKTFTTREVLDIAFLILKDEKIDRTDKEQYDKLVFQTEYLSTKTTNYNPNLSHALFQLEKATSRYLGNNHALNKQAVEFWITNAQELQSTIK